MKKDRRYCSKTSRYNKALRMKILSMLLNVLALNIILCPTPSFPMINTLLTMTMPCRCVTCREQFLPGRIAVLVSLCNVAIKFEMLLGLGLNKAVNSF